MSNFVIYLQLEPFVSQWLTHSYGSPVKFPAQSVENATIRRFLAKQPEGATSIEREGTAIALPDSKAKPTLVYNHLGKHGKAALTECIEDNFKRCLWMEMCDADFDRMGMTRAMCAWCEMHGISVEYADTIRQRFYRIRESYRRKGIGMMRRWKTKEEKPPF